MAETPSWATIIRQWWDELFHSRLVTHLEQEITYLRNQTEQLHLENAKLQLFLNAVQPAGILAKALEARKPINQTVIPGKKRWQDVQNEHMDKIRKQLEAKKEEVKVS